VLLTEAPNSERTPRKAYRGGEAPAELHRFGSAGASPSRLNVTSCKPVQHGFRSRRLGQKIQLHTNGPAAGSYALKKEYGMESTVESRIDARIEPSFDIVVASHLRWSFVWQRPQQLLSRLAKRHRILFVEEPVYSDHSPDRVPLPT